MKSLHIRYVLHPSGTVHATLISGDIEKGGAVKHATICVQRGYFSALTGVGRNSALGTVEVTPFIAAAVGFIVPSNVICPLEEVSA
jgi:hypothetical protein